MKTVSTAILLLGWGGPMVAQNLVRNPSFEEYAICPDFWSQTERAIGWSAYRNSPDYFNACESTGYWSVPYNVAGYQPAATGQAYCGMLTWCPPTEEREHIGAELLTPLIPGVPVSISFKMVATTSGFMANMGYAASGVGVLFTMEPYYITDQVPLPNHAALYVDSAVIDTANWLFVSGMYVPDSAYRYIVIGGMFSDSLIELDTINVEALGYCGYVYVDDICVSMNNTGCLVNTGQYTQPVLTSINVYPNPCVDQLFFERGSSNAGLKLWIEFTDVTGRILKEVTTLDDTTGNVSLQGLPFGTLLVRIRGESGLLKETLVVHVAP